MVEQIKTITIAVLISGIIFFIAGMQYQNSIQHQITSASKTITASK